MDQIRAQALGGKELSVDFIFVGASRLVLAQHMLTFWSVGFAIATDVVEVDRLLRIFRTGDKGPSQGPHEASL